MANSTHPKHDLVLANSDLLGRVPDSQVAEALDVNVQLVAQVRRQLGRKPVIHRLARPASGERTAGQIAYELRRDEGIGWAEVATAIGSSTPNSASMGARQYAKRYGHPWPIITRPAEA